MLPDANEKILKVQKWNTDDMSKFITELVQTIPDRPRTMVAIINYKPENDAGIAAALKPLQDACFSFRRYKNLGVSFGVFLFGYDSSSEISAGLAFGALASIPFDEGAIYIDGQFRIQLLGPICFGAAGFV